MTNAEAQAAPDGDVAISRSATAHGFSPERLAKIRPAYQAGVDAGEIPGAVILISRDGQLVYSDAVGYRDVGHHVPMTRDTRFRLASMTKPVTAVAALILMEEGKLTLTDPVSKYLPELSHLKVGRTTTDPKTGEARLVLEPVSREPTIFDLFRHMSGITYPPPIGSGAIGAAYAAAKVMDPMQDNRDMVAKLAGLPLTDQPGTTFEYGMSTDVLGRIVEVISGQSLGDFIAQRITGPLGMRDTDFSMGDPARLALMRQEAKAPADPRWQSGGGGLVGTARDYLRFARMLENGGELDGVRILAPATVAFMTTNHLPPDVAYGPYDLGWVAPKPETGYGYGAGIAVRVSNRGVAPGNIGDFQWPGSTGTYFWVDPSEHLAVVVLTAAPEVRGAYRLKARALVYQAMVR